MVHRYRYVYCYTITTMCVSKKNKLLSVTHQVGLSGCVVFLCTHANQTVVVEEDAERVT